MVVPNSTGVQHDSCTPVTGGGGGGSIINQSLASRPPSPVCATTNSSNAAPATAATVAAVSIGEQQQIPTVTVVPSTRAWVGAGVTAAAAASTTGPGLQTTPSQTTVISRHLFNSELISFFSSFFCFRSLTHLLNVCCVLSVMSIINCFFWTCHSLV